MPTDYDSLLELNIEIGLAEARGDARYFEKLLAPAFAMRRANGEQLGRDEFLAGVATSAKRNTRVESISLYDACRALVICVVEVETVQGSSQFHNLRLFTRNATSQPWKLMAWANAPEPRRSDC